MLWEQGASAGQARNVARRAVLEQLLFIILLLRLSDKPPFVRGSGWNGENDNDFRPKVANTRRNHRSRDFMFMP